uniref:Ryanodine Receptor TM 4-6 domain-containing protein n=1 Tax=Romanomermis culicivorax TaxID=13658 RepID=A0A915IP99_ROMCU
MKNFLINLIYFDASSVISGPAGPPMSPPESLADGEVYEPKIAETANKSRSSFFGMFARRYFMLKQIAMGIAFFLNFILLFYQVQIFEAEPVVQASENVLGVTTTEDSILGAAAALSNETGGAAASEEEEPMEEILLREYFPYMSHILQFVSLAHCLVSFALLVAYYQLK